MRKTCSSTYGMANVSCGKDSNYRFGRYFNWKDAVEFMLAGASAIQIGTYNFVDPTVSIKVIDGLNDYCDRHGFKSVKELIGALDIQR